MTFVLNRFFWLFAVIAVCPLIACSQAVPVHKEDVAGRLWLKEVDEECGAAGFFAGEDGQLFPIGQHSQDSGSWEVLDNRLLLRLGPQTAPPLPTLEFCAKQGTAQLVFVPCQEAGGVAYVAESLQEPLNRIRYFLMPDQTQPDCTHSDAFLMFDVDDRSLRGYAGVNNFYGTYQRRGVTDFKSGPMTSTKMAGPGMDEEIRFMQCLEQANALLVVRDELFYYRDFRQLCSFRAE